MPWPNFFVIGAAKSGTSSLHRYLGQHPDIFTSREKEPDYFAAPRPVSAEATAAYLRLFDEVTTERALGESSTAYLNVRGTAERIRAQVPDARLIAVLRHPVDRAYSHFLHNRRRHIEPLARFEDALAAEPDRSARTSDHDFVYLARGRYAEQLSRYLGVFPAAQLSVHLYDDLVEAPRELMRALYGFLEVDETFEPDLRLRHNLATTAPEHQRLRMFERLLNEPGRLKEWVKRLLPSARLRMRIRRALHAANRRRGAPERPPPLSPGLRAEVTDGIRDEIERLQDLLDRDLSCWLET